MSLPHEADFAAGCSALSTLRDFIRYGASRFNAAGLAFGHGTDNALDEAAYLVLHALHLPPDLHATYHTCTLTEAERARVCAVLAERIATRKPAAYLTRTAYFAGHAFYVDERVVIPRSPIAELIERQFAPWIERDRVTRILDLCTGSGCIGIACAHAFPEARVDLVDLSEEALAVARANIARHGLEQRVHAIHSDLYAQLPAARYDVIVSNPPYIPTNEVPGLPAEYHHEPQVGLAAGPHGLNVALRILAESAHYLSSDGILVVEVGDSDRALMRQRPELPYLWIDFERGGGGVFVLSAAALAVC